MQKLWTRGAALEVGWVKAQSERAGVLAAQDSILAEGRDGDRRDLNYCSGLEGEEGSGREDGASLGVPRPGLQPLRAVCTQAPLWPSPAAPPRDTGSVVPPGPAREDL